MEPWRIGVSTQTPLVRWGTHGHGDAAAPRDTTQVAASGQGLLTPVLRQYDITPGGVSRMVLQSLRSWHAAGRFSHAAWFSLQPSGPARIALEGMPVELHHLTIPGDLGAYARTKEKLWADLHGLPSKPLDAEDFRHFMAYNHATSDAILERAPDLDAVYVHDFQLLQVGAMVGLAAPCVLRWHVPFVPRLIPDYTRNFLLRMMESFDGVIVSTRRDLLGLTNSGFRGTVRQIYPHTDAQVPAPTAQAMQAFEEKAGLRPEHQVLVCVARMDPMKRQDLAIQAFALLRHRLPHARLILVGNGSFSGSKKTGLGLSKAQQWRSALEEMAAGLGVADRVVFTGWMPDPLVDAAYARADVLVLPSDIEGFGLTPFEAWRHGKPCVVTSGCGASEVVQDGVTGRTVPSGDPQAMADAFEALLSDREGAERMGEAGRIALRGFTTTAAAEAEWEMLETARMRFRRQA